MRNRKYLLITFFVVLLATFSLPTLAFAQGNGDGGTTGEALAVEFFKALESEFNSPLTLLRVRVHETAKNSFLFQP